MMTATKKIKKLTDQIQYKRVGFARIFDSLRIWPLSCIASTLCVLSFLSSCGGTIGNLQKYEFSKLSVDSLKKVVEIVNQNHPEFRTFDSVKYDEGKNELLDGDFYCTINEGGKKYLFLYAYPVYPSQSKSHSAEIALISAAEYGDKMYLANEISNEQKKRYIRLFDGFINQLKIQIHKK